MPAFLASSKTLRAASGPSASTSRRKVRASSSAALSSPELSAASRYTEATRKARVQGIVILESIVDAEGCVSDVRVRKAVHPELDQASLTAVRQWVFQPAELRGKPVNVFYNLSLSFQLEDSPPAGGGAATGGGK